MKAKQSEPPARTDHTAADEPTLDDAIRDYVRTYAQWRGRPQAAQRFGVSRHTLWRFLERGRLGRSLPRAVVKAVGDNPQAVNAATEELVNSARRKRKLRRLDDTLAKLEKRGSAKYRLSEIQEDTLRFL